MAEGAQQATPTEPLPDAPVVDSGAAPVTAEAAPQSSPSISAPASDAALAGAAPAPTAAQRDPFFAEFGKVAPQLAEQFTSPVALARHLYEETQRQNERLRELSAFAPYAQQYAANAGEFQAWKRQQDEARRAAVEKQKNWFNPPEYDPAWEQAVYADQTTGELKVRPGYPPDTIQKLAAARQHQRQFVDKLTFDPIGAIRPGLEQVIREVAGQLVQQHLGGHEETTQANEFIQQNASWLFTQDNTGPNGRRLSEWGQRFAHYAQEAESLGLAGTQKIQTYAMGMVQRDYAAARLNTLTAQPATPATPAVSANDQHKQQFLAGAQQQPAKQTPSNRGGASPTPGSSRVSGGDYKARLTQMALDDARQAGLSVNGA